MIVAPSCIQPGSCRSRASILPLATRCVQGIRARGHRDVIAVPLEGSEALSSVIKKIVKQGDYVVFLGAGNITQWAHALPGELAALDNANA